MFRSSLCLCGIRWLGVSVSRPCAVYMGSSVSTLHDSCVFSSARSCRRFCRGWAGYGFVVPGRVGTFAFQSLPATMATWRACLLDSGASGFLQPCARIPAGRMSMNYCSPELAYHQAHSVSGQASSSRSCIDRSLKGALFLGFAF